MSLLDKLQHENDIKKIRYQEYDKLADEIRAFLINKVSDKGGHLASNLGSVELTMALHLCMDFPKDKLIFDVGHQSYTHKILTGRKEGFNTLREFGGMSGFPKRCESDCDAFDTGHSSTSISAAMGFAVARDVKGSNERVAAIIGDGSLTGGMAYEALNSLSELKTGCVIILNDNEMSIAKNVGGLSTMLNEIRVGSAYNDFKIGLENRLLTSKTGEKVAKTLKRSKDNLKRFVVPGSFFDEIGITYVGPIDGHDIGLMVKTFKKAFNLNKPIIIHVKTKKGKGYNRAEKHPDYFHGIAPFDVETGRIKTKKQTATYTDVFSNHLLELGNDKTIMAITAAMAVGTGLNHFEEKYPERFFDVGIAEQHAVTFAAGLAAAGMKPVVAIYSSFLQRAYDQILHDVCLQKLHVVFAIDRAGLVGKDGETHQGLYDVAFLSHMPHMTVLEPKNRYELVQMMDYAFDYDGPIAIRYPKGSADKGLSDFSIPIEYGKSELIYEGDNVAVISCGCMMQEAVGLCDKLKAEGVTPTLINARFVSSVDTELISRICDNHKVIITMEENISEGGYGERLAAYLEDNHSDKNIIHVDGSICQRIVPQGDIGSLRKSLGIDADGVYIRYREAVKGK